MIYVFIAASIFGGELVLKNRMDRWQGEDKKLAGGHILLCRSHNKGAFLNLGEKRRSLVCALSLGLTVCLGLLFIMTLTTKGKGLLKSGLSLLLGGAFSNTYDRLHRKYVVDYFHFHTGLEEFDRIVFNLADFCILIGALLCVLGESG